MIGMYKTALPKDVEAEMRQLLDWYHKQEKTMKTLAEFHARYESIHPFQDGNWTNRKNDIVSGKLEI